MVYPLKNPKPDINYFLDVVHGKIEPDRVLLGELKVDDELLEVICKEVLHREWFPRQKKDLIKRAQYWDNVIEVYYRLGYDFVRVGRAITFPTKEFITQELAVAGMTQRKWVTEGDGVVTDKESFESYAWPKVEEIDTWDFRYVDEHLPEGMGLVIGPAKGILEVVTEIILGFTGMSYMLYDDPDLVEEVFIKTGDLLYAVYEKAVKETNCVGFFQGDDMGYKTGLMFSKKFLKKYVLSWHKRLADLAHENGLIYIMHSCGNLRKIGDEILELGADVKHSFEDSAWSVFDYKLEYGEKITLMGGVDVDKLARYEEKALKEYCNKVLDACMPGGRYIYGSGNSVTNYVPLKNYLTMLEVGLNWKRK